MVSKETSGEGEEKRYEYDSAGNIAAIRTARSGYGSSAKYDVVTQEHDRYNRKTAVNQLLSEDSLSNPAAILDSLKVDGMVKSLSLIHIW